MPPAIDVYLYKNGRTEHKLMPVTFTTTSDSLLSDLGLNDMFKVYEAVRESNVRKNSTGRKKTEDIQRVCHRELHPQERLMGVLFHWLKSVDGDKRCLVVQETNAQSLFLGLRNEMCRSLPRDKIRQRLDRIRDENDRERDEIRFRYQQEVKDLRARMQQL